MKEKIYILILTLACFIAGEITGIRIGKDSQQEIIEQAKIPIKGNSVCCNAPIFIFPSRPTIEHYPKTVVCDKCHLQCKTL